MAQSRLETMLEDLAAHAKRDDLARLVRQVALEGDPGTNVDDVRSRASRLGISEKDAETPLGNVMLALGRSPANENERTLVASLLARGLELEDMPAPLAERDRAACLVWLATAAANTSSTSSAPQSETPPFGGELMRAPRGLVATALLAVTGILFVCQLAALIARYTLAFRRSAEVRMVDRGIAVRAKTELLGKVVRDRETVIPLTGLVRATREIRYPRLGMYAGLVALTVGSYVGVGWFVDGVRAASPTMATVGLLTALVGIGLDFALGTLMPGARGLCRIVFVPRRGPALCVGTIDPDSADRLLAKLARATGV